MKRLTQLLLVAAIVAVASAALVAAPVTSTGSVTVNATVSATAKLIISAATVNFPDADPDTAPLLTAGTVLTIDARGKTSTGSNITLTVAATDDLKSGSDTIAIGQLTWVASGTGFAAGTMAKTAVSLGTWQNSGSRTGTQTYKLANSWDYATGSYATTVNYTLTAP